MQSPGALFPRVDLCEEKLMRIALHFHHFVLFIQDRDKSCGNVIPHDSQCRLLAAYRWLLFRGFSGLWVNLMQIRKGGA